MLDLILQDNRRIFDIIGDTDIDENTRVAISKIKKKWK